MITKWIPISNYPARSFCRVIAKNSNDEIASCYWCNNPAINNGIAGIYIKTYIFELWRHATHYIYYPNDR
jgi:hypothetical protein